MKVAIVGSGPSGFYAAEALLRSDRDVEVDMFERLPFPYGLVRSGVAPDHPKLKEPIRLYARIAAAPGFHFFGNVTIGTDVTPGQLQALYDATIITCGAESDRRLGIPGEDLPGSHTAREFVGWYNGHPDFVDRKFDLSHRTAVIFGQGNVAADVARILAKSPDQLKYTDIAGHALDTLARSRVRDIHVIGRRGPAQAKFTARELREFGQLENCQVVVDRHELALNPASEAELADRTNVGGRKVMELFGEFARRRTVSSPLRRVHFTFLKSPRSFRGTRRVEQVQLEINTLSGAPFGQSARGTGRMTEIETGIAFCSIGYKGSPIAGLPFDHERGIIPNRGGRVVDDSTVQPNLYVAGWIKRGPTGVIGTNRADSVETVQAVLEDAGRVTASTPKPGRAGVLALLEEKGIRHVDFLAWQKIDRSEVERGLQRGKPREKYTSVPEMLALVH